MPAKVYFSSRGFNLLTQQTQQDLVFCASVFRMVFKTRTFKPLHCKNFAGLGVNFCMLLTDWIAKTFQPAILLPVFQEARTQVMSGLWKIALLVKRLSRVS